MLPLFDFWLSSLRAALDKDPYWGPNFWKDLEPRASNLEHGICHMVRQCIEFENMGQSGNGAPETEGTSHVVMPRAGAPANPSRRGAYELDGQKLVFVSEENRRMHRIILGCWTSLLADAANVGNFEVQTPPNSLRSPSC